MSYTQLDIFGNKKAAACKKIKKKVPEYNIREITLARKIKMLYALYEQLYEQLEIDLMEQQEIIIKNNIIAFIEERQAEPIELINLELCENIDFKLSKMRELLCREI